MKTLIAYYSRSGKNKKLAEEVQKKLNCDIEEIIDTKNRKGILGIIVGGMNSGSKKFTKIESFKSNPKNYEQVIIISPVWVGIFAPATRTYISVNKDKIKELSIISVSGSGKGNTKAIPDLEKILGKKISNYFLLSEKEFEGDYKTDLDNFLNNLEG